MIISHSERMNGLSKLISYPTQNYTIFKKGKKLLEMSLTRTHAHTHTRDMIVNVIKTFPFIYILLLGSVREN